MSPYLNQLFDRYDRNNSGKLEPNQLSNMLKDMNEGVVPTAEEVRPTMSLSKFTLHCVAAEMGANNGRPF